MERSQFTHADTVQLAGNSGTFQYNQHYIPDIQTSPSTQLDSKTKRSSKKFVTVASSSGSASTPNSPVLLSPKYVPNANVSSASSPVFTRRASKQQGMLQQPRNNAFGGSSHGARSLLDVSRSLSSDWKMTSSAVRSSSDNAVNIRNGESPRRSNRDSFKSVKKQWTATAGITAERSSRSSFAHISPFNLMATASEASKQRRASRGLEILSRTPSMRPQLILCDQAVNDNARSLGPRAMNVRNTMRNQDVQRPSVQLMNQSTDNEQPCYDLPLPVILRTCWQNIQKDFYLMCVIDAIFWGNQVLAVQRLVESRP